VYVSQSERDARSTEDLLQQAVLRFAGDSRMWINDFFSRLDELIEAYSQELTVIRDGCYEDESQRRSIEFRLSKLREARRRASSARLSLLEAFAGEALGDGGEDTSKDT